MKRLKKAERPNFQSIFNCFKKTTHYDYDIHEERALLVKTESRTGSSEARRNVKTLLQENRKMATTFPSLADQQYKRMDYVYDIVSGNVNRMSVQNGELDQWHHAYRYDADNRIISAHTNKETPIFSQAVISQSLENELTQNTDWQQDAAYFYYSHGPLARAELGTQLQGIDYVYNLQGWLKGVNATSLDENLDPGRDGSPRGTDTGCTDTCCPTRRSSRCCWSFRARRGRCRSRGRRDAPTRAPPAPRAPPTTSR